MHSLPRRRPQIFFLFAPSLGGTTLASWTWVHSLPRRRPQIFFLFAPSRGGCRSIVAAISVMWCFKRPQHYARISCVMIGQVGVKMIIITKDIVPMTPDKVRLAVVGALADMTGTTLVHPEHMELVEKQCDQAMLRILTKVKLFLGDSARLDGGSIGEPVQQPRYVFHVKDALEWALMRSCRSCSISIPSCLLTVFGKPWPLFGQSFCWWTLTTPLSRDTMTMRASAFYIFVFTERL